MVVPATKLFFRSVERVIAPRVDGPRKQRVQFLGSWQLSSSFSARTKVSNGAAQSKPDDFNKKKYLNWWWGGNVQLAYMVDTAKTYLVELNTRGSSALFCLAACGCLLKVAVAEVPLPYISP